MTPTSILAIIIALLGVVLVGWLIAKKVHAAASLLVVGFVLLMLAAALGLTPSTKVKIEPTGNNFLDELLVMEKLFSSRIAGTGLMIMVLFGFVSYMRHIGADAKAVVMLTKPLSRFRGSYWLVVVGFLVGNLLSMVIPSASALSLLLVATLVPALIAAGLTPLTVGAIVVTSSTVMPSPLEAGLIRSAGMLNMSTAEYAIGQIALPALLTVLVMAFVHMFWNRWCDKKDEEAGGVKYLDGDKSIHTSDQAMQDALERADKIPGFYALLPLLPLLIMGVAAGLKAGGVVEYAVEIVPATIISIMVTLVIESIRLKSLHDSVDSIKSFFAGLGEGAAGVVSLIIAAAVLVEGITQLGLISLIINATKDSHSAAVLMVVLFALATAGIAMLTGSGVAPFNAFAELVPQLAKETNVMPGQMLASIWGPSNTMRQVSPVNAAILVVSGAIKVNPIQLVKRTVVPMIVGTIVWIVFVFLFVRV